MGTIFLMLCCCDVSQLVIYTINMTDTIMLSGTYEDMELL